MGRRPHDILVSKMERKRNWRDSRDRDRLAVNLGFKFEFNRKKNVCLLLNTHVYIRPNLNKVRSVDTKESLIEFNTY